VYSKSLKVFFKAFNSLHDIFNIIDPILAVIWSQGDQFKIKCPRYAFEALASLITMSSVFFVEKFANKRNNIMI
jgi:uncharacterized integral membrane protein